MPQQFLRPYHPKQVPVLSSGSAASSWHRLASITSRRWPFPLAGLAADRKPSTSRLMAAVHTDVVGYSRLFALDDVETIARLREVRRSLIAPAIRRHDARLVQTSGDEMLITFDSVAQAVKCAVTIQHELATENALWPHDRQMQLRVGVDLGDVTVDETVLHGDGVIIAARLQAICPPGGVCVSRAVHERGGNRLGLPFEALGQLALKNVAQPVEAFVLWPAGTASSSPPQR